MNWSDCEAAWKRQPPPVASAEELEGLQAGFEARRRQLARARFVRAVVDASMGPLVCLALAFRFWLTGRGGWPTLLAMLVILGGFGASWYACRRSRQPGPGADAPLVLKVDADIAELARERRRLFSLRTSVYGPVIAVVLLIPFVLFIASDRRADSFAIAFSIYFSATLMFGWLLNRREIRRRIDPRLDELEKLRRALAAGR